MIKLSNKYKFLVPLFIIALTVVGLLSIVHNTYEKLNNYQLDPTNLAMTFFLGVLTIWVANNQLEFSKKQDTQNEVITTQQLQIQQEYTKAQKYIAIQNRPIISPINPKDTDDISNYIPISLMMPHF